MLMSMQIVVYLFLGGAAGGMLLVACGWSLVERYWNKNSLSASRFLEKHSAFEIFFTRCVVLGALSMFVAILCLFWDLGRPERALGLIFSRTPNILSFGAVCLGLELSVALILSFITVFRVDISALLRSIFEGLGVVISVAVILYTGVYLYSMASVAFWHSYTLLVVFFFSALSTGFSFMLLVAYFSQDQALLLGAVTPLQKAHVTCIVLEAIGLVAFVWAAMTNSDARESMALLLSNEMLSFAVVGVGGMALLVPCVLELYSISSKSHRNIPASDVICLVGGLILRYVIVACGLH